MRIRRIGLALLIGVIPLLALACATIIHGTRQEVALSSTPTGARVILDGQETGTTPYVTKMKRKDKHTVRIELAGYQPYELATTRSVSGWIIGNILFGGVIGLAVDAISGGMYKLKPEEIQATLMQQPVSISRAGDVLIVAVVLEPNPDWERIGQLEVSPAWGGH